MISATGSCSGIENYSRHLTGRKKGEPHLLYLNTYPKIFFLFIDESHVTIPELGDVQRR